MHPYVGTTLPRRVAVFTSTRADAGPLGPVIDALAADSETDLQLIVTGAHLTEAGRTARTGLRVPRTATVESVPIDLTADDPTSILLASADLVRGLAPALGRLEPDILLVLGDRWELLPVATAAVLAQVPLAHLHGGEVTEGAMDERFRHAVTKLADLHLCVDDDARRRLLQLGEEPWRVVVTGAPALDRLRTVRPLSGPSLDTLVEAPVARPFGLLTYHPPTVERHELVRRVDAVLDAATRSCATVLATHPGPDPGAATIRDRLEAATRRHRNLHVVPHLGRDYPSVLASADVLIGNSSSGIFEAASFGVPVVNVGDRQQGRTRPTNVIDTPEDLDEISNAILRALSTEFADSLEGLANPFGDGHAADRVVTVLRDQPLGDLAFKRFVNLDITSPGS